jgi:hypothetical protein
MEVPAHIYRLKWQPMKNNFLCTIGKFLRCTPDIDLNGAFRLPYIYDYITKLFRQHVDVVKLKYCCARCMIFILRGDIMSILLEIIYKLCIIEYIKWTTGWLAGNGSSMSRLESRVTCRQSGIHEKFAYESVGRHGANLAFTRQIFDNEESADLGVWMDNIFMIWKNVEFYSREVEAVLGHSDSSSRSEQSTRKVCVKVSRDGVPAIFILRLVWSRE